MTGQTADSAEASPQASPSQPGKRKAIAIAAAGGLLTGLLLVALLARAPAGPELANLAMVAPTDIAGAATTLAPAASAQLVAQAKSCTVPLAHVAISAVGNGAHGTIRIRSGAYLSPAFHLTATPQVVAIPFPAPYAAGRGELAIVGNAAGVTISLSPTWRIETLSGTTVRPVVWTPKKPC
jgi:hypothetical protein